MPQADATDPLVGQPILNGKYRILSIIGEGGMGKVYLAEQKLGTATRKVAIKTLQPDLAGDPQIIARFHRETQTVIELEHPNTIKFYDFGELEDHGKKLFVVMEYIQGEGLSHVLARGPLDVQRAERIMAQVCGSLQEAHERGIIHRDLKPDNIILTQKGARGDFVKVLDFGIAKRGEAADEKEAKLTRQGMVLGTPPYMSPEQFTGQQLDARSDIYALGVIAYEMLTGVLPFNAQTPWEWATKHLTTPPTPIEQQPNGMRVPERHRRAIMRALAKNRDERPATVSQFIQEFTGSSEGAGDWTASSTSMGSSAGAGHAPQPVPSTPGFGAPQMTPGGGFQPTMASPGMTNTPNPFYPGAPPTGGFVPAPSNAGFAAVPPNAPPGMAGSNPGFPNPVTTGGFIPIPSGPGAAPPVKKSRTGLIIAVVVGVAVLAVGGLLLNNYYNSDDDEEEAQQPASTPQQPQQPQQMQPQQPQQPSSPAGTDPSMNPLPTPQPPVAAPPTSAAPPQPAAPPAPALAMPSVPTVTPIAPPATAPATAPAAAPPAVAANEPPAAANTPPAGTVPPTATGGGRPSSSGGGDDPRVGALVSRGISSARSGDFGSAISSLQDAQRIDSNASGVRNLRNELRRVGHNRISNLVLAGNCGAAQSLFRQLRSAGAAPSTDSFGDACPAP